VLLHIVCIACLYTHLMDMYAVHLLLSTLLSVSYRLHMFT
jgi:hypothetical protein